MLGRTVLGLLLVSMFNMNAEEKMKDDGYIQYHGYNDCVKLENKTTKVIVSGACGGRVLEYSLNGVNAIYLDPLQDGWTYTPGQPTIDPCGGRMDIAPECTIPKHPDLWLGSWKTERTGPLSARMTSVADKATGVQLVRDFVLAPESSTLKVTQTIKNVSAKPVRWCHWSRTLAPTGGVCIIPLTPNSRFPEKYVIYEPGLLVNFRPKDDNVVIQDDTLFITGCPRQAKLGFDSYAGRFAYLTQDNLLFTKDFPVYPDRVYGELSSITICIYYHQKFCELEPIGPQEFIAPEESASYTETWSLRGSPYPADGKFDFAKLAELVK